jgi:hypothetical protein
MLDRTLADVRKRIAPAGQDRLNEQKIRAVPVGLVLPENT